MALGIFQTPFSIHRKFVHSLCKLTWNVKGKRNEHSKWKAFTDIPETNTLNWISVWFRILFPTLWIKAHLHSIILMRFILLVAIVYQTISTSLSNVEESFRLRIQINRCNANASTETWLHLSLWHLKSIRICVSWKRSYQTHSISTIIDARSRISFLPLHHTHNERILVINVKM